MVTRRRRAAAGLATVSLWLAPGATAIGTAVGTEVDLVAAVRDRLALIESHRSYRHWSQVDEGEALAQAAAAPLGPLHGAIVAVKDNIDLSWLPTSAGATALVGRRPMRNATVVDRLLAAGAVVPGHTNMDTWARGVRSVSQTVGATANARNPRYGPMGSSGGSAVAVALGDADAALGTDTCGSLRYPAAANLILALRPTPGLVSRAGVVPLSPTQDVVGPMALDVGALATLLDVIAGPDSRDPLTATAPIRDRTYTEDLSAERKSLIWRVGVIRGLGAYRQDSSGETMLMRLRRAEVVLVDVELPSLADANVIDEEYLATRPMVLSGADEKRWLAEPLRVANSARYRARLRSREDNAQRLVARMDRLQLDALVYPTTPYLPSLRGAPQPSANCHVSATSGLPALTLPLGLDEHRVPVPGIDLLGRPFDEERLLQLALAVTRSPAR